MGTLARVAERKDFLEPSPAPLETLIWQVWSCTLESLFLLRTHVILLLMVFEPRYEQQQQQ